MKKLMLVMGLLSMVVFTHAAESKKTNPIPGIEKQLSVLTSVIQVQEADQFNAFDYSITLKVSVGPSWARIEVSCTASGSTADEAFDNASNCLAVAQRRMSQAIK